MRCAFRRWITGAYELAVFAIMRAVRDRRLITRLNFIGNSLSLFIPPAGTKSRFQSRESTRWYPLANDNHESYVQRNEGTARQIPVGQSRGEQEFREHFRSAYPRARKFQAPLDRGFAGCRGPDDSAKLNIICVKSRDYGTSFLCRRIADLTCRSPGSRSRGQFASMRGREATNRHTIL